MSDQNILISNGTCYSSKGKKLDDSFIPCGNAAFGPQTCCGAGDNCLANNACWGMHGKPDEYGASLTYIAGCTDPDYEDSSCPKKFFNQPWEALTLCNDGEGIWAPYKQEGDPTTLQPGSFCSCTDSKETTIAFSDTDPLANFASLPGETGKSVSYFAGHTPTAPADSPGETGGEGGGSDNGGDGGSSSNSDGGGAEPTSDGKGPGFSNNDQSNSPAETGGAGTGDGGGGGGGGGGVSSGTKIGIGVGVAVALLLILGLVAFVMIRRRRQRRRGGGALTKEEMEKRSSAGSTLPPMPEAGGEEVVEKDGKAIPRSELEGDRPVGGPRTGPGDGGGAAAAGGVGGGNHGPGGGAAVGDHAEALRRERHSPIAELPGSEGVYRPYRPGGAMANPY